MAFDEPIELPEGATKCEECGELECVCGLWEDDEDDEPGWDLGGESEVDWLGDEDEDEDEEDEDEED